MQLATERSVKGDFVKTTVALHGLTYLLRHTNSSYFITESSSTGRPWQHRIDYTLGDGRYQHYLSTLPDGRIILLPPTWDAVRKEWVHDLDVNNPEESPGDAIPVWNKSCYACHVSRGEKNFDLQELRYHTTWQDLGINCESCHGPGAEHISKATGGQPWDAARRAVIKETIVNPARLDSMHSTMICAQCHSFRDVYSDGFKAGENYYDFFLPVMEYRLASSPDPDFWPDGRTRRLSNEALGLWQSQCFLKGSATCSICHSRPHALNIDGNPELRTNNNSLCAGCHKAIARDVSSHSHHAPKSSGSSCIECHMPPIVTALNARIRDHSMSLPVPENTIRHGVPNACNLCHQDKDAEWTLRHMNEWYGDKSREKLILRADAFVQARENDSAAIPALLQILSDPSAGPWIRANAAGYLGNFPNDPSAFNAVLQSFSDPQPLVRATAVSALRPRAAQREAAALAMVPLLRDAVRTVSMSAAIGMVAMGVQKFPGEDGERFERAKGLYRARAELNSDDAQQQLAAGKFFFLSGDMDSAVAAFRATMKLDPGIAAQYFLARSLAEKGDYPSAREILGNIPHADPQYASAQQLLAEIEAKEQSSGASQTKGTAAGNAQAKFLNGQVLLQKEYYGAALKELEQALQLSPKADWATKAEAYRAICLEKLSRTREAEAAMLVLSEKPEQSKDVDLQLAMVELLYETGRLDEARKRIDTTIAAVPEDPMAHFWRSKVLLELHHVDEAAIAAEESIRLLPELPPAHNLLLRIYQMQGRTKEAAQQAQWLRDYQRRIE